MTKEEFIGKMIELKKDNKYVFQKVCESFDTCCDGCPLRHLNDCEALMIDELCDVIIDLQNKKAEPKPTYRLRQFEYDLIVAHQDAYGDDSLLYWAYLKEWQKKGYLKNIPDDVGVGEILENAEVIEE